MKKAPRFIAFEGPDGVGKSTIMRILAPRLAQKGGYKGFVFFHWKPVPGALHLNCIPDGAPHNPRSKQPRGLLASLPFLLHHWLDFQIGFARRVRPALSAGLLVVCDRYAYDVLVDPARFRLKVPKCVLRLFVRTIPRPDIAIVLQAPPDVVRRRKPELTIDEITAYQNSFSTCPLVKNPVFTDASGSPESIAGAIEKRILAPSGIQAL